MKAVLVSFNCSDRANVHYQQRCRELAELGASIRENFAELRGTGHPKWKEVDLDQEIGVWKRDARSRVVSRASQSAPQTADDLFMAIIESSRPRGNRDG